MTLWSATRGSRRTLWQPVRSLPCVAGDDARASGPSLSITHKIGRLYRAGYTGVERRTRHTETVVGRHLVCTNLTRNFFASVLNVAFDEKHVSVRERWGAYQRQIDLPRRAARSVGSLPLGMPLRVRPARTFNNAKIDDGVGGGTVDPYHGHVVLLMRANEPSVGKAPAVISEHVMRRVSTQLLSITLLEHVRLSRSG